MYSGKYNSSLNNQFDISDKKGINNILETDVQFIPSSTEQRMFDKLNNAINNNLFDLNEDDNDVDSSVNCNYYSRDEFVSAKFNQSKYFSTAHLSIHSAELHIEELRTVLAMLEFKFDIMALRIEDS